MLKYLWMKSFVVRDFLQNNAREAVVVAGSRSRSGRHGSRSRPAEESWAPGGESAGIVRGPGPS